MNLESSKISVNKSPEALFNFLSNIKNFESLMPENISKFEVLSDDTFLFALKGMPEIALKRQASTNPNQVVLSAAGGKLDFSLTGDITQTGDNASDIQLKFSGDFNPMMAMMIKNPIKNFIETLVTNIPKTV